MSLTRAGPPSGEGPIPAAVLPASGDNPEAYIAGDRRRALAAGRTMPDRVHGAALFADISGFTPLTEALLIELGAQRGAETVGATLDTVFSGLLGELHRHGGSVIYFSGDAVTCWLDGDDGTLAVSCALAMQEQMREVGRVVLPSGRAVALGLKVAVAAGRARRFVVGDPEIQLIDVLAGALVDDLAAAEQHATRGEVVLEPATLQALGGRVVLSEVRVAEGRRFGVVAGLAQQPALPPLPPRAPPLPEAVVRQWLLPAVYERMRTGRGEFLAELRPAIPVFLRFGGIDFDAGGVDAPDPREALDDFVVQAQRIIDRFGGNALQLTLGDKGAYLYAVFGSPIAHEDDAARACAASLQLLELPSRCAVTGVQIGIAQGRLRSGTYGHSLRRTFCCLGDAVNLAARLMSRAPAGSVYVSEPVHAAAAERFDWTRLPELHVKGKADPIAVFELTGRRAQRGAAHRRHALPMIGRAQEMAAVTDCVDAVLAGRGRVLAVSAEAGMGKSRLLADTARLLTDRGVPGYEGEAEAFGTSTGYAAWRTVWTDLFALEADASLAEHQAQVEQRLAEVDPALVARAPLLGPVLGLTLPDNELTAPLDAKLRKASLEQLLAQYLAWTAEHQGALAVMIEDCHWLDPLSQDLLVVLARALASLPVLLVLAYRDDGAPWHAALRGLPHARVLELDLLDADGVASMVAAKVEALFGMTEVPAALMQLVLERSEGNPFHVEELLSFLQSRGVDPADAAALADLDVPESLHSLVLSRVDRLSEPPRRTLKVASVIGRLFHTPTLLGSYPALGSHDEVDEQLTTLRACDLVLLEAADTEANLFRHSVTRDVAYDSMPYAMRELLHGQVGAYLEAMDAADGSGRHRLDLLAHHYGRSAIVDKKREYLLRAGEAAQATYNNAAAVDYLRRALPLLAAPDRGPTRRRLGQVLEIVGEWAEAERVYGEALTEAEQVGDGHGAGAARLALAEVARKQGRYGQASALLAEAEDQLAAIGDDATLGQALHTAGTLAAQQGRYDEARERYGASLAIRRRLGDRSREASLLGNLGILAEYEGDYAGARRLNEQALELRTALGDQWAIGASLINIGMAALLQDDLEAARDAFAESMRLMCQVGDPWMIAVDHNNLGNTLRRLGDLPAAAGHYADGLRAYGAFDDRWAQAILFEDIAALAVVADDPVAAFTLIGAADRLREDLGSPRSPVQQAELDASLADAAGRLAAAAGQARSNGHALDLDAAVSAALQVCERAATG